VVLTCLWEAIPSSIGHAQFAGCVGQTWSLVGWRTAARHNDLQIDFISKSTLLITIDSIAGSANDYNKHHCIETIMMSM